MNDILFLSNLDGLDSSNSITYSSQIDGGTSFTAEDGGSSFADVFVGAVSGETSEQRIKNKISTLVRNQFPEFIRTEYEQFLFFVETYYKFLETDSGAQEIIQNALSYSDIDKTTSSFVYYFLQNYAKDFPLYSLGDKKFIIKHVKDLYEAKGSSLSFKLLFQLLFKSNVDINYPYENVLKTSDGTWDQRSSIGVTIVKGSRFDIVNRFLIYTVNNAKYEIPVLATRLLATGYVEIFLDHNKLPSSFNVNDYVYSYNTVGEEIFKAKILSTPTSYSIIKPGQNFKVGQIFNINSGDSIGSVIKVTSVSPAGGVEKIKFINFGFNYPDELKINLDKDSTLTSTKDGTASSTRGTSDSVFITKIGAYSNVQLKGTVTLSTTSDIVYGYNDSEFTSNLKSGSFVTIDSNTYTVQNVVSNTRFYITTVGSSNASNVSGFAVSVNPTTIYFAEDYLSALEDYGRSLNSTITNYVGGTSRDYREELTSTNVPDSFVQFIFYNGALANYPGAYTTSKGFISEENTRVQNDLLYQPYAYQLTSEIDVNKFYDIVIKLVHPAGQKLFNNRTFTNKLDLSANIASLSAKVGSLNFESFSKGKPTDENYKNISKAFGAVDGLESVTAFDDTANTNIINFQTTVLDSTDVPSSNISSISVKPLFNDGTDTQPDSDISSKTQFINEIGTGKAYYVIPLPSGYTSEDYFSELYIKAADIIDLITDDVNTPLSNASVSLITTFNDYTGNVDASIFEPSSNTSITFNAILTDRTGNSLDSETAILTVPDYLDYNKETYFAEDYTLTYQADFSIIEPLSNISSITFNTVINDLLDEIDNTLITFNTSIDDYTGNVDASIVVPSSDSSFAINTSTQDTTDSSDSGTVSLGVANFLDYNNQTYFAEDYASTYSTSITTF